VRRGIVRFALAIAFVVGAMSPAMSRAAQTPTGISTDPILQPPFDDGQPIDVTISLHVLNLANIDEVSEQFQLDGYLYEQWMDKRLAYIAEGPQDQVRNYTMGQIWIPEVEIINAAVPRSRDDVSIRVSRDGTVRYVERFIVSLSSRFRAQTLPVR